MNKKVAKKVLCSILLLLNLLINPAHSQSALVINASDSTGEWNKGVVTGREVVHTSESLIRSEVQAYIENPGKYQLFSYIHHNYREAIPCIYAEVSNDKGILYSGSHRIENIWYLDKDYPGRWFMVSLTQDPYWELPRGNLTIRFWVDALKAVWNNDKTAMEGDISIDKFLFIPVRESGKNLSLPWFIYPEVGKGNWNISEYHHGYATNLVESGKSKETLILTVDIPYADHYKLSGQVLSLLDNDLSVIFRGKSDKQKKDIKINGRETWSFVASDSIYLNHGEYKIILKHTNSNPLLIDYLILLPNSTDCTR
ncbi:MAG: hypothetical protein ABH882_06530 [Candidatus Omnitrophota bacterium]|nr:hypothetical protein [Candidatus Omnitrophota bacterium]MBU1928368.1 hypothetical protein [Candidatus Omnitrophota bacterium]MBU2035169.1 hypothetical protein [Candidatus Omnitrophota bacterium]MBU2258035.1 hypothetical protein [Candidatus Omnitrophota bacterium]